MKIKTFLFLLSLCLYLTSAVPISDSEADNDSGNDDVDLVDGDESEFGFESGNDDDDWFGDLNDGTTKEDVNEENKDLDTEQVETLEKLRKNRLNDHVMGTTKGSSQANDRLMRELRDIYRSESFKQGVFSFELVEDSVYEWNVFLHSVDSDSVLYKDLEKWKEQSGQDYIQLNFHFNDMFPIEPPFVRIVSPVITGNFFFDGGAICMELLTKNGWSAVYSVEAVITQIASTLVSGNARIPQQNLELAKQSNNLERAKDTFKRIESVHKGGEWITPPKNLG